MVIDIHTHYIDYETEMTAVIKADIARCGAAEDAWKHCTGNYVEATTAADIAFIYGIRAKATGWLSDNARIATFARNQNPGRYVFVASVDPMEDGFMDQLIYAHLELGAKMLKLCPIYQGLHPHDEKYRSIYTYCQKHNIPIITHMATTFASGVPLEYARPVLMDRIACEYPRLKIILTHLGHPWEGETIAIIRKQPNVYADISALYYRPWQFYNSMRLLEEYGAQDKVFFGSDYPATTTADSLAGVRNVNAAVSGTALPPVSNEVIEGIIYRNPIDVLGI